MLQFFNHIAGRYIVAGQQEIAWSQERKEEDFDYIKATTGRTPALRGFDFLQYVYSPTVRATQDSSERAIAWARQGGLVAYCCHLFMNIGSTDGNPQFYTPGSNGNVNGTRFDIRQAVISGTPENVEYLAKLDIIAGELGKLRDAGVPVIWRPFHEAGGTWFWWSAQGAEPFKAAWRIMFDRFTQVHGLTNLIWCFNPTDSTTVLQNWYPGDDVVDMISLDVYPPAGSHPTFSADYKRMRDFRNGRKVVVMSENGAIPEIDALFAEDAGWGYFCTWNGFENNPAQNSAAFLQTVYNHAKVITLDELPALYAENSLTITAQPRTQLVAAGTALTLSIATSGGTGLAYQWSKDGAAIPGATSATYSIGNVTTTASGTYTVTVTGGAVSVTSAPADVAVAPAGAAPSALVNISSRAYCSTGNRVAIGGFVVSGTTERRVLVRAVGPTLTSLGIGETEVLLDPTISVYHGSSVFATNDNWGDDPDASALVTVGDQIGANRLLESDTHSSAMLLSLTPGVYSFVASGRNSSSGIVLLEVYDAQPADRTSSFVNISTRAYSTTGNGVTIGGFVIAGETPKRVLLRAVGSTLTTRGISDAEVLADPVIELHRGSPVIASNDNWGTNSNAAEIVATGARIGAAPLAAGDTSSSALLLFLQPGPYTFIASGKSNASGIVLVEVYDAD